jgi:hypothetical protein
MKYNYNVRTGLVRVKTNTKKYFYSGLAAVTVLAFGTGATFAASTVSSQASSSACFGQARAYYAKGGPNGVLSPNSNGTHISERKGDNPSNNATYIETFCNSEL